MTDTSCTRLSQTGMALVKFNFWGVLYVIWKGVGKGKNKHQDENDEDKHYRMSVDCANSSRGLFLGLFLTIVAIIAMIAFYVLKGSTGTMQKAVILVHLSEFCVYAITTLALVVAADRMKELRMSTNHPAGLEETLILISFTGLFIFAVFSIIAGMFYINTPEGVLTILTNIMMMVQATMQTIFMIAGDRLSACKPYHEKHKPGREFITFLVLCNFSMWLINTFETQIPEHNPLQLEFYGPVAWAIFSHVSVPLGIFYRFHSSVCLSNIWKNAWKVKSH